ncbi:MAG: glutamine synthetase type III, partial [Candidatus Marinimicrobia bacterium]|nr:glutamine synthetase type III [Candidatus Neomarinimicrobiota bacterium]
PGVSALPDISRDDTDRNRTSPFAFTVNKFEFRMVSSQASLARPNMILNTIIADQLSEFAERLEGEENITAAVTAIIRDVYNKHKRIIFNGDGYSEAWHEEAEKRGLPHYEKSVDVFPVFTAEKNVALFEKHGVLSRNELVARTQILLKNYTLKNMIEAATMVSMAEKEIRPAFIAYQGKLARTAHDLKAVGVDSKLHVRLLNECNDKLLAFNTALDALKDAIVKRTETDEEKEARFIRDVVTVKMEVLRETADALEMICDKESWPMPTYAEMLFKI